MGSTNSPHEGSMSLISYVVINSSCNSNAALPCVLQCSSLSTASVETNWKLSNSENSSYIQNKVCSLIYSRAMRQQFFALYAFFIIAKKQLRMTESITTFFHVNYCTFAKFLPTTSINASHFKPLSIR